MVVMSPEQCERLYGGSVKDCQCRLPNGTWAECPPEARGILGPAEPPFASVFFPERPQITGEMCHEPGCGGFLVRTGSCLTCQSCGANEGCG
jgi:hypothetical protein